MINQSLEKLAALGIRVPVMQAGMPGVAHPALAAAVARAGGIGTLGLSDISVWEDQLKQTKALAAGRPVAANLLLPYTRQQHVDAVIRQQIPIVTLFWGSAAKWVPRLHQHGVFVFQQIGSKAEAAEALAAGIDGLIVQGTEAGGHVRGTQHLSELLPQVVGIAGQTPVFAAGGIYTADDVRRVMALGACGVSTGTRFLLTPESNAHPAGKQRLLDADQTLLTTLFGLGWAVPHRVVANQATATWCDADGRIPGWLQAFNAALSFTRKLTPFKPEGALMQKPDLPLFSAACFVSQHPESLLESTALYR